MSPKQLKSEIDAALLREKAESQLVRIPVPQESVRSAGEMLHELQVRQIELEMQNEELRSAHLALEKSRDHYADFYEFAPISYITLSRDGLITEINLTGAVLLGEERNKILGRRFARYITPGQRDAWHLHFSHALKTGETQPCEFTLLRGDGSIIHVFLDSPCGEVGGAGVLRIALTDITWRRQMEQQLRLEEFVLDHAHEAAYLVDAEGRFVYVNAEACRALGYSRDELLALKLPDIDAHYSPKELLIVRDRGEAEGTFRHETLHRRRDGSTFSVEILSSLFDYQGRTMGLVLARDITERKRYEAELVAAKKILEAQNMQLHVYRKKLEQRVDERTAELGASNKLLREEIGERKQVQSALKETDSQLRDLFVRREAAREDERKRIALEIHDELGQILTGLKLHVSSLARMCAGKASPFCEHMQEITDLTDEALKVARNITVVLHPVEADAGIVPALELQASRFSAVLGIPAVCTFPDDTILLNERCTTALYRIVQESLTNIARHAQATQVDISLGKEGGDYVLTVRDNGIGFDVSAKKENSFGLLGIRERTRMLGGTVNIESGKGWGTEIIVRIPEGNNRD